MPRDRVWADTREVADRMTRAYGMHVRAVWRRRRGFQVEQGLAVDALSRFEVVRQRRVFSSDWEEVKPVAEAASLVGAAIRAAEQ